MAVDLSDYTDSLMRAIGTADDPLRTTVTSTEAVGYLADAFWDGRLQGFFLGYSADGDGLVTPSEVATPDFSREQVQLVVLLAAIRILRHSIRQLQTTFRTVAGPVQFEVQRSAQVLKAILDDLTKEKDLILVRLSDLGSTPTFYIDSAIERDRSINVGLTAWISG